MQWRELTSVDQLDQLIKDSRERSIAIFKHSTRCSISSMAKNRLERSWNFADDTLPIYYLDLIRYRDVSDEIARVFDVQHESPQLLLVKDGAVYHHVSHNAITADNVTIR